MPNSPKELTNIDLKDLTASAAKAPVISAQPAQAAAAPKPAPQIPETPQPAPNIAPIPVAPVVSAIPAVPKPVEESAPVKPKIPQQVAPKINPQEIFEQPKGINNKKPVKNSANEYLYNKSTIGGIDQSKLEYKETFKKRVNFNVPKHTYSWVILFVLISLGIGGGVVYYLNPELFTGSNSEPIVQPIDIPPPPQEDPGLRDKLLQVKAPFLLENDEIIKQLKTVGTSLDSKTLNPILSNEMLERITSEFKKLEAIILAENMTETPSVPVNQAQDQSQDQSQTQDQSGQTQNQAEITP